MAVSERVLKLRQAAKDGGPATLSALKRFHGLTDVDIADLTGIPRSSVRNKFSGVSEPTRSELVAFAAVLGVPVFVLFLDDDSALRWVLDHREDVEEARVRSRCCSAAA